MRIETRRAGGSPLVQGYLAGEPLAAGFFTGHPLSTGSYREKLVEVQRRFGRAERERVAAAVRPTSAGAADRLRKFVEEGGAVVTTGQQAGLFGGPLYTIYKILTAIRLAGALEEALGTVVLPVFWIASDDHDFAEVNHTHAVDPRGELHRLSILPTDPRPLPMSEMRLGTDVRGTVGDFAQIAAPEGYGLDYLMECLNPYEPERTLAAAFRGTIERLFASFDLLVTDAADPAVKLASVPILLGELEAARENERRVAERTAALRRAGFGTQVALVENAANVFFHGHAGRERLVREGDDWLVPQARRRFSPGEIAREVQRNPESFSPNVFLRPVVESAVFPTLAYVGGPAETAYLAQVQPLFDAFGIRPPVVFPRFGATLVPEEVADREQALGVPVDELHAPEHQLLDTLVRERLPREIAERLRAIREGMVAGFGGLIDAAHGIDPNLDRALGARRNRALLEVAEAERKIVSHAKKAAPDLAEDLRRVRNHLRPLGEPQERVLNVFQFLPRHPTLLHDLAAAMRVQLDPGGTTRTQR